MVKKQPFSIYLVALILGILFQDHFILQAKYINILLIINFLTLFLVFFKNYYSSKFKDFFSVFFVFILGVFLLNITKQKPPNIALSKKENIVFSLDKKLNISDKNRRYEVTFYKNKSSFKSILSIPKNYKELDFSHFYKAEVYIKKTEKPYADFGFNYQKYLARKNIFFEAYLPQKLYESGVKKLTILEQIKNERLKLLNKISNSSLDEKSSAFLKGIILADRTSIDSDTVSDFQNSGLIHLLAISGTHIGIIFGLIYLLCLKIFPVKFRSFAIILSLIFIWSFALFIGLGNSVVRACIMISVYFTYVLINRKPDLLHAISLAGLIILIVNPQQIFDVGFQLSFCAVFGIYWLYEPILNLMPRSKSKAINFIIEILAITLTAQLTTLPLVLFYFHQFSFISILANLIVIPLAEILIAFSLFLSVILGFSINILWFNTIYDFLILNLLKLVHWFATLEFAMNRNVALNFVEVILIFISLYFLKFLLKQLNWKNLLNFGLIFIIFIGFRLIFNFQQTRKNEVLTHFYFNKKIISIKNAKDICFLVPEKLDQKKVEKYVINPYLISVRNHQYKIKTFNEKVKSVTINNKNYPLE